MPVDIVADSPPVSLVEVVGATVVPVLVPPLVVALVVAEVLAVSLMLATISSPPQAVRSKSAAVQGASRFIGP